GRRPRRRPRGQGRDALRRLRRRHAWGQLRCNRGCRRRTRSGAADRVACMVGRRAPPRYWEPLRARLVPDAVVVVNSSLFEEPVDLPRVFEVPATEVATEQLGNPMAVSMVATGAYVALTGLVTLDSAIAAMRESLPAYRRQ